MTDPRDLDLVVWGATGFTGRLVAEYLLGRYGASGDLCWAMGGRSETKLERIRSGLGEGAETIPLLVGDSHDPASLDAIATRAKVVCSTVGPFARYGSELVAACARHGTHYCDITGEVQWMRRMIDAHQAAARESGARIVHACGFDSIPSDLGCLFVQEAMRQAHGHPCDEVKLRVRKVQGAFSGGTVASMLNALEEVKRDRGVRRVLGHPYSLNPDGEQSGPDGSDQRGAVWDPDVGSWTAPFVMAAVNTRVVRRSNALLGYAYGHDFRYSEAMMTGRGPAGWARAAGVTAGLGGFLVLASMPPSRTLLEKLVLPKPGDGPSKAEREAGFFDLAVVGKRGGVEIRARVRGDRDPGYGATCRMLGESAVCLARDAGDLDVDGGFWTPASAMGRRLIDRLRQNAGMSFELE